MTDPRRARNLTRLLTDRLVDEYGGVVDRLTPDVPASIVMVLLGDLPFYVTPDVGEPTTSRAPVPDTVLLSACPAVEVADLGAAELAIHEFTDDPTVPSDVRVWTTSDHSTQVWLDRLLPATAAASEADAAIALDEFVLLARRLRTALAPVDTSSSEEALVRALVGGFTEPLSYEFVDDSKWRAHPWLSRIERRTNIDGFAYLCLFGLTPAAADAFCRIELQFERADGTWQTVPTEIPGPYAMPGANWAHPSVAWSDETQWGRASDDPTRATGRWRARVPTGWSGPPI